MKKHIQQTKILLILCFTLTFIVSFASVAPSGLASAQNNTLMQPRETQNMSNTTKLTNIVLVHGAWADGSSWNKVIPILEKAGHKVIAVQLATQNLADDIATVKRAIEFIGGPVTLVGHSYGGAVITNAAYNNPNVTGLVYQMRLPNSS
jgi:pimeloyl-ACP methyl ester carboxylesterase